MTSVSKDSKHPQSITVWQVFINDNQIKPFKLKPQNQDCRGALANDLQYILNSAYYSLRFSASMAGL